MAETADVAQTAVAWPVARTVAHGVMMHRATVAAPNSLSLLTGSRVSVASVFLGPQRTYDEAMKKRKRGDGELGCPAAQPSLRGHRTQMMRRVTRDAM